MFIIGKDDWITIAVFLFIIFGIGGLLSSIIEKHHHDPCAHILEPHGMHSLNREAYGRCKQNQRR